MAAKSDPSEFDTVSSEFDTVSSEFDTVSSEFDKVESPAEITDRQASRVVAAYATDADECRVLLAMLGIGPAKIDA